MDYVALQRLTIRKQILMPGDLLPRGLNRRLDRMVAHGEIAEAPSASGPSVSGLMKLPKGQLEGVATVLELEVEGTGKNGRVLKSDLVAAVGPVLVAEPEPEEEAVESESAVAEATAQAVESEGEGEGEPSEASEGEEEAEGEPEA